MPVTKDPVLTIIRKRTEFRMKKGWATPILISDFIPGLKKPKLIWGDGQLLERMAYSAVEDSPTFQKLGVRPQRLATGLELAEEESSLALADERNAVGRLRVLSSAVRGANDAEVKAVVELVNEGQQLLKAGALDDKVPAPTMQKFSEKFASQLEGPLHRFSHVFTADSPKVLLQDIRSFDSVFSNIGTKLTRDQFLVAASTAQELVVNQKDDKAKQIRATFEPVADAFTAAVAYCINGGFDGEFAVCHIPRSLSPTKAAEFVIEELIEKKQRCYDVVLLDPIPDASVLTTHWVPYFSGEELVQATVFASLDYQTLDELDEKASSPQTQAGTPAAHFCLTAGFGKVLGRRCPIAPAVAGGRLKRDGLLNPRGGHFGLLESSFGCQEDRMINGYEDVDVLALRDAKRARYAKNGVNTPAITDGIVHLFRAVSLSSDIQLSQYDTTRAANWFIGTLRQYMRRVTVGECNDPVRRAMVAANATEELNKYFIGKTDFDVVVTPGESTDPREFVITLSLPEVAYVETIKIFVEFKDVKASKK